VLIRVLLKVDVPKDGEMPAGAIFPSEDRQVKSIIEMATGEYIDNFYGVALAFMAWG
jgi:hypothetical protein